MPDVFSTLLGQERIAEALRHYVAHPVHAYLFHGSDAGTVHDTIVHFAAGLECHDHGCGACESCRLVLEGKESNVHYLTRSAVAWSVDDIRSVEMVARRRPLGGGFQIIVIEDIELLATPGNTAASALLKILEEPPTKTIFLLGATELPESLTTIESRCVNIPVARLSMAQVVATLEAQGVEKERAVLIAAAANGSIKRARVLERDPGLTARMEKWRALPDALDGTTASAIAAVKELRAIIDEAIAPMVAMQAEGLDALQKEAKEFGSRGPSKKDSETKFKREQRAFRSSEFAFGFVTLSSLFRERLAEALLDTSTQAEFRVKKYTKALDALTKASERLSTTLDESLLLDDLVLGLLDL
jgi:DNA polymerase-3 subunit delta'